MKLLWTCSLLVACATDPKTVDFVVPGAPTLFEGKVADGPWQTFSGKYDGTDTHYSLELDADYELVLATSCGSTSKTRQLFGTAEDAAVVIGSWPMERCTAIAGEPITVTGTMIETSELALDAAGAHHNLNGFGNAYPFTVETRSGAHDLVLWNDTSFEIVHDVQIAGDTSLGDVSLDANASPISVVQIDIPIDPDEEVSTVVQLLTRNGTGVQWSQAPEHVFVMPTDQLGARDSETLMYTAWSDDGSARIAIESEFVGLPGPFDLLPRIHAVSGARDSLSVSWTPFDEYFTSATAQTFGGTLSVTMSRLWLERHPGPVAFDDEVPSIDGAVNVYGASEFSVTRQELNGRVVSTTPKIVF